MQKSFFEIQIIRYMTIVIALIPYAFISLYCDAMLKNFTLIGYVFALFCMIFLLRKIHTRKERVGVFLLSIVSLLESYFLANYFLGKEWNYYFKPFTASNLVVAMMGVFLVLQLILILKMKKHQSE